MFFALAGVASLAQLVCLILVLIKMFQDNKIGLGVVSILCGIVAFVYGWMNVDRYRIKNVMIIWTAALVVNAGAFALAPHTTTTTFTSPSGQTTHTTVSP